MILFKNKVPTTNFKSSVQKKYDDFNKEVNELNSMIKKKEHEVNIYIANVKLLKIIIKITKWVLLV